MPLRWKAARYKYWISKRPSLDRNLPRAVDLTTLQARIEAIVAVRAKVIIVLISVKGDIYCCVLDNVGQLELKLLYKSCLLYTSRCV